jgi:hypothetical protein
VLRCAGAEALWIAGAGAAEALMPRMAGAGAAEALTPRMAGAGVLMR